MFVINTVSPLVVTASTSRYRGPMLQTSPTCAYQAICRSLLCVSGSEVTITDMLAWNVVVLIGLNWANPAHEPFSPGTHRLIILVGNCEADDKVAPVNVFDEENDEVLLPCGNSDDLGVEPLACLENEQAVIVDCRNVVESWPEGMRVFLKCLCVVPDMMRVWA